MMVPRTRVPTRKSKTRTGCRTCKIRRIKCDEHRPACLKCSSTGRKCDGYDLPASVVHRTVVVDGRNIASFPSLRPLVSHSPTVIPQVHLPLGLTSDESQAWDYFRSITAVEIHGCFQSDLWERLVLQISHEEPSILHASIALGSMHRLYKERGISTEVSVMNDPHKTFSLRQYVKALVSLRTRLADSGDNRAREVSLMTCLLFISLEMLQGQRIEALTHLRTGLKILSDSGSQGGDKCTPEKTSFILKHDPERMIDHLSVVFARLDFESTMFGVPAPYLNVVPEQNREKLPTWVPATFFNIQEARQYLDSLSSSVFRFRGDLLELTEASILSPSVDIAARLLHLHATARGLDLSCYPKVLGQHRALQSGLSVWLSALKAYKSRPKALFSSEDNRAITLLEIQQFYLWFIISCCQSTKEMACDSFNDDFARILTLSSSYLKGFNDGNTASNQNYPLFSLESGVIPSLYLIGMKCRHPEMRRRAISMIYNCVCQEGMWEGRLVARYVEQIADFEEAAAQHTGTLVESEDIPEIARFSDVILAVTEDPNVGRLVCARYRHEIDGKLHQWEELFPIKK